MTARMSRIMHSEIEYGFWLIFAEDGSMRFTRTEPGIGRGERKMKCSATLPRSLFKTPELKASITVSDPGTSVFNLDIDAASSALKAAIGCDVDLRVEDSR